MKSPKKQQHFNILLFIIQLSVGPCFSLFASSNISCSDNISVQTKKNELLSNDIFKSNLPALTGNIKVLGRQLIVDGNPFIMKGICYNPVRKGGTHPTGLITLNPTKEDIDLIEKDFQMMHDAGINTIRTYEPLLDQRILDLLVKYQLRTIVPALNYYEASFEKVTSTILTLKDHPSTLIWEVGNEWNLNCFYSRNRDPANPEGLGYNRSSALVKNAISYIKILDTTHPVSTVIGGLPTDIAFWNTIDFKGIDIYGLNIYHGLTLSHRLHQWSSLSNKPLYIGEFGADAFNTTINSEDDESQKIATYSLLKKIHHNLSAVDPSSILIGGCSYEWCDEWWKEPQGSPYEHDNYGITDPFGHGGPYPDYVFNEEWWGIVDIDRNPRPAYQVLKELYTISNH
ncbi:MAG: hypothetical protein K2W97_09155 [Chthoniobacterales bacterium]|nr:hypothetical protein [Chthoniobacterales bacterium]